MKESEDFLDFDDIDDSVQHEEISQEQQLQQLILAQINSLIKQPANI